MSIPCFLLSEAPRLKSDLRRYRSSSDGCPCPLMPGSYSYHDVSVFLVEIEQPIHEDWGKLEDSLRPPKDDPRWPRLCGCGYQFRDEDQWQVFTKRLYTRSDTGELTTIRDAPAGALWYADWMMYADENGVVHDGEWKKRN